jgi:hypothetical protein
MSQVLISSTLSDTEMPITLDMSKARYWSAVSRNGENTGRTRVFFDYNDTVDLSESYSEVDRKFKEARGLLENKVPYFSKGVSPDSSGESNSF